MPRLTRALATTGVVGLLLALGTGTADAAPGPAAAEIATMRAEVSASQQRRSATDAELSAARTTVVGTAQALAEASDAAEVAATVRPVVLDEAERAEQRLRVLQQPRRDFLGVGQAPNAEDVQAAQTWLEGSQAAVRAADDAILAARLDENAAQMAHARAQAALQQATRAAEQAAAAHEAAAEILEAQLGRVDPASGRLARPATGEVTSVFGPRPHPLGGGVSRHGGVDYAVGDGTAYAAASGAVVAVGWNGSYGLEVVVDHGDGLSTRYAHLSAAAVTPGQPVVVGDALGAIGSTGASTGPHLHFEVITGETQVDPSGWVD
jgi:murein DD-endopeptidase MepM/ murein hydrolase activator NlpD